MRTGRTTLLRGTALLGVLVVVAALAPSAGAANRIDTFVARSLGRGIEATLGPRQIVIDPLTQVAGPFTRTELNSIPQSASLAGIVFPGDLPLSVLDEEGTAPNAGAPAAWLLTLRAPHSKEGRDRQRDIGRLTATESQGVHFKAGHMRARAFFDENIARAEAHRFVIQPDPKKPPLLSIRSLVSESISFTDGTRIVQETTVRASGVSLLDGAITIGGVTSIAYAISNGTGVPQISATTEIANVLVKTTDGASHRAVIDDDGVRIEDPLLSHSMNQSLTYQVGAELSRIGMHISTMEESIITDGAAATATAGGLLVRFTGACEACPSMIRLVPSEVRGLLSQVPDIPPQAGCILSPGPESPLGAIPDIPRPIPFCLTMALVPIPPDLAGSISLAGVFSEVASAPPLDFSGGGFGGGGFGGVDLGGGYGVGKTTFPANPGVAPPVQGTGPGPTVQPPSFPLFGVFAEMPDGVLAGLGAMLLLFAVGMGLRPSLRRGDGP